MAQIFTTPEARQTAKAWFHDLAYVGGLINKNMKALEPYLKDSWYSTAVTNICNELVNRDFANINNDIQKLNKVSFYTKATCERGTAKRFNTEAIAKAIVYAAELLGLYWDDTIRTPYEIDEFKKTLLGAAVYKYGRYISAIPDKTTRKARGASSSGNATGTAIPPKNNYKQSGPQSGNVRDLLDAMNGGPGTPGQKIYADTALIYKIIGDNPQSKNTPNVFIKPLSATGATGTTNKIFISSGNGYTDCTCYFDDPNDAQSFLDKIIADNRVPNNVTNMRVVKMKADSNGYFLVGTEYGPVAISAKTLNEALAEAMNEEISDWAKATENYSKKELDELHTWMRRG